MIYQKYLYIYNFLILFRRYLNKKYYFYTEITNIY